MGSPEEARVRLPQLRLDELLEELQARLDAARGTRDRVHSLLEAVLAVGRELDLEQALRSIVEAAAVLVDAEYAALGVIGPDGKRLSAFHTVGVSEEQIAEIGPYPQGHGILGELIRRPEPLRLAKISDHPASYGFPAHHPPMNTFLGVPIRVRDQVFGNLYLTEKRGGALFDEDDVSVTLTLAVAAGVAIDNARLYAESRQRERWLRANAEITHSLMSGGARTDVLGLIAERAGELTRSALAAVASPMEDTGALAVEVAVGTDAEAHRGLVLPMDRSLMGLAFAGAAPVTSADVGPQAEGLDVPGAHRLAVRTVPVLQKPDRSSEDHLGVLDRLEHHPGVGDRVGAVPLVRDLRVRDVQPTTRGVRERGHHVRGEVDLPRRDRVAEAYEHGAAPAFYLDGEIVELVIEVLMDHLADRLHEVQGALLTGAVRLGVLLGEDDAEVDVSQGGVGVAVRDAPVVVGGRAGEGPARGRGQEQAAALGLSEFLVGHLDLAASFVEELRKGLFANH
ncbi:GAF domain-containing protein [Streptomyces sp. NPDC002491]